MAVTIRDVAREAGVSVATASHALTGYTDISVKTRQKIQETYIVYVDNEVMEIEKER